MKSVNPCRLVTPLLLALLFCFSSVSQADSWGYRTIPDKMTSKEMKLAAIVSDNSLNLPFPYNSSNNFGELQVRNRPGKGTDVIFSIQKGQIICPSYGDGCTVTVRFDQAPPIKFGGIGPTDNSSDTVFLHDTKRFIAGASKAKKILVQVTMYQAGSQTLEFSPPSGLVWPIKSASK